MNPPKYCEIVSEDALYLVYMDVNLFNNLKHYKAKDYLKKDKLYIL